MVAKLESTLSTAYPNKDQTQNPHKHCGQQVTMNQQHQYHALELTAAKATGGLNAFYR